MGEVYCHTVPNSTLNRDKNPPVEKIAKAIGWDPGNAAYWYKLGIGLRNSDFAPEKQASRFTGQGMRNEEKQRTEVGGHPSEIEKKEAFHGVKRSVTEIGENLRLPRAIHDNDERSGFHWGNLRMRIVKVLERSVELNPFEAQYHLRLGWEYAHLWKEPDYHTKWLPAADISMDRAAYFAGGEEPAPAPGVGELLDHAE